MSEPRNHHWLPRFILRPWCGNDGLVTSFHRPRDKVVWKRMSLKALGSERDLNTSQWKGLGDPQVIEKEIMSKGLDEPAAKVRNRLLTGGGNQLTGGERNDFTAFLISLPLRHSGWIRPIQESAEVNLREAFRELPRTVDGVTRTMTEKEATHIYDKILAGYINDIALIEMVKIGVNSQYSRALKELQWRVFKMLPSHPELVISDRPIQTWGDNGQLERLIIPISPKVLFVAGTPDYFENEPILQEEFREVLAVRSIGDQFRQAQRFVVARNLGPKNGFLKIAEKNMCLPDGSRPP